MFNNTHSKTEGLGQQLLSALTIQLRMVQLASKFTARIGQNAYLPRFFVRHEELQAFDAQVSRLLVHPTMLTSYAARDLHVLTHIPTRDRFLCTKKLIMNRFSQYLLACVPSEFTLAATLCGTLFAHGILHY